MTDRLAPGAVIGILGGGQLGRMLVDGGGAARLPLPHLRAGGGLPGVSMSHGGRRPRPTRMPTALRAFARSVDVVTYEFENVPAEALDLIEAEVPIRPGRRALAISQDRLPEKEFVTGLGLATAPFAAVETEADLAAALDRIGAPAILKTRRLGYDGKGQARIMAPRDAPAAFAAIGGAPSVLEGFVDLLPRGLGHRGPRSRRRRSPASIRARTCTRAASSGRRRSPRASRPPSGRTRC